MLRPMLSILLTVLRVAKSRLRKSLDFVSAIDGRIGPKYLVARYSPSSLTNSFSSSSKGIGPVGAIGLGVGGGIGVGLGVGVGVGVGLGVGVATGVGVALGVGVGVGVGEPPKVVALAVFDGGDNNTPLTGHLMWYRYVVFGESPESTKRPGNTPTAVIKTKPSGSAAVVL